MKANLPFTHSKAALYQHCNTDLYMDCKPFEFNFTRLFYSYCHVSDAVSISSFDSPREATPGGAAYALRWGRVTVSIKDDGAITISPLNLPYHKDARRSNPKLTILNLDHTSPKSTLLPYVLATLPLLSFLSPADGVHEPGRLQEFPVNTSPGCPEEDSGFGAGTARHMLRSSGLQFACWEAAQSSNCRVAAARAAAAS